VILLARGSGRNDKKKLTREGMIVFNFFFIVLVVDTYTNKREEERCNIGSNPHSCFNSANHCAPNKEHIKNYLT
jgi:hypothetical protein